MTQPFLHMAPAPVDQAGANLASLTEAARKTTDALFASTASAAKTNTGWLSTPALAACGNSWHPHLTGLTNQTSALAWSVVRAARAYHAADQETARRLEDVLKTFGTR